MGALLTRAIEEPLDIFAERRLFAPMGIRNYRWTMMRQGLPLAAGGFYMTPRDMAKIGQMMLDGGVWQGRRILSQAWVRQATGQQTPAGGYPYGFYWHLNATRVRMPRYEAFMALGQGGQSIVVIPEKRTVIVTTSADWRLRRDEGDPFTELTTRHILPALDAAQG